MIQNRLAKQANKQTLVFSYEASIVIKGIAAVMIMLGHFFAHYPWYITVWFSGYIWVGVFFFYSGYGLKHSLDAKGKNIYFERYIRGKLIKIYLPFCLAELFYVTPQLVMGDSKYDFKDIILGIIGVKLLNPILWYVLEILIIYLLFYFIYAKLEDVLRRYINYTWIVCYIFFLIVAVLLDIGTWWYISTSAFVIGIFVANHRDKVEIFVQNTAIKIVSVILAIALYVFEKLFTYNVVRIPFLPSTYIITFIQLVVVPTVIVVFIGIDWSNVCKSHLMKACGSISYEIYLYQMVSLTIAYNVAINNTFRIFLSIVGTFIMAWIMHYVSFWCFQVLSRK